MSVSTDPGYAALASSAAAALGAGSPDVARAILAQWQCELGAGAPYPPLRNNPGNIARGLASELGLPYTVAPGPNPQPGNPIVTYPTAAVGAQAYAAAIATHSRYAGALRAARAGDGLAFVRAIGSSGWGTGLSCMLGVYRGSGASGSSSASSTSTATLVSYTPNNWSPEAIARARAAIVSLGIDPTSTTYHFSFGDAVTVARAVLQANTPQVVNPVAAAIQGQTPADLLANRFNYDNSAGGAVDRFLNFDWVPGFAVNAGVLVIAVYLVLSGVRDVLGDPPATDAALLA